MLIPSSCTVADDSVGLMNCICCTEQVKYTRPYLASHTSLCEADHLITTSRARHVAHINAGGHIANPVSNMDTYVSNFRQLSDEYMNGV